jgi:hypothetical protein
MNPTLQSVARLLAIVLILLGSVWTLQGLNVLLGSPMSGDPFWAKAGGLVLLSGLTLGLVLWRIR